MKNEIFSKNLKDVMKFRKVTQKQLAEQLCCSTRCVQNYCYGRQPDNATIIRICKILNVCEEDMMFKEHLVDIIRNEQKIEMVVEKLESSMCNHSLEKLIRQIVRDELDELKEILESINDKL